MINPLNIYIYSCFAPRAADRIIDIAKLCKTLNLPHMINNAYGLMSTRCCQYITQAQRRGRVDCAISSTDKNFMVPVGGSLVAAFSKDLTNLIAANYPGRASMAPLLDVFITSLSLGNSLSLSLSLSLVCINDPV